MRRPQVQYGERCMSRSAPWLFLLCVRSSCFFLGSFFFFTVALLFSFGRHVRVRVGGSVAIRAFRGCETPQQVSYSCKCSFYEIFNEKVFDLVDESNRDNPMGLTVREDTRKGVYVEGLMEEDVSEREENGMLRGLTPRGQLVGPSRSSKRRRNRCVGRCCCPVHTPSLAFQF